MKLLFVYNARSGKLNAALDAAHKWISPSTYQCSLCSLTHGALAEKDEWKAFRSRTALDLVFLHKDEFERSYDRSFDYPVILRKSTDLEVLLCARELGELDGVRELIVRIEELTA